MNLEPIAPPDFKLDVFSAWEKAFLLTCGDFQVMKFNTMTIGWGAYGIMWGKPFVQVVVRPTRYTYQFMEEYDTFTVTGFPPEFDRTLDFLGTVSGRKRDKIQEAGLTPIAAQIVEAPAFAEATLVIECKKIYFHDLEPAHFLATYIPLAYMNDYHRVYYGEILGIWGTSEYINPSTRG